MVADLAARMGKRVSPLAVTGGHLPVIAEDFEALVGSFAHIVRNMVDHGIELPGEREAKGKPPEGKVSIDIKESPEEIVFTFSDDGRGVQLEEVERRARELGLVKDGDAVPPRNLLALIFRDAFSTAPSVSHVSGRGVGLSAVQEEVRTMGGRIVLKSAADRGSVFTVTIPRPRVLRREVAS
jgi:chemosensory pili system protein ChpA (sensor histidine kinase/response regulator)